MEKVLQILTSKSIPDLIMDLKKPPIFNEERVLPILTPVILTILTSKSIIFEEERVLQILTSNLFQILTVDFSQDKYYSISFLAAGRLKYYTSKATVKAKLSYVII